MFLLEHQQQAHLEAALRRDAVETVLVEADRNLYQQAVDFMLDHGVVVEEINDVK